MTAPAPTVLVAEDDEVLRETIREVLTDAGWVTAPAVDGAAALTAFRAEPTDVVLTDLMMPGRDGLSLVAAIRQFDHDTPIVILTGYASLDNAVASLRAGASDFLQKPFRNDELLRVLQAALAARDPRLTSLIRQSTTLAWGLSLSPPAAGDAEGLAAAAASEFAQVAVAAGFGRRQFAMRRACEALALLAFSAGGVMSLAAEFSGDGCRLRLHGLADEERARLLAPAPDHISLSGRTALLLRTFADECRAGAAADELEIVFYRPGAAQRAAAGE